MPAEDAADRIAETIDETAADGVQSASQDGRTATSIPIPDLIRAEQHAATREALRDGGSAWARTRPARVVPPGAVR